MAFRYRWFHVRLKLDPTSTEGKAWKMLEKIKRYFAQRRQRSQARFEAGLRADLLRIHGHVENIDDRVRRLVLFGKARREGRLPHPHETPHPDDLPHIQKPFDMAEAIRPKVLPGILKTSVDLYARTSIFNRKR